MGTPAQGLMKSQLTDLGNQLHGLYAALEGAKLSDVTIIAISEFGRRLAENGSGTDHGAAGIGFLMGSRVSGRMIGEFPGLDHLDDEGNLRATADFRGLYGSLAGDWFGVDPAAVLPGASGIGRPVILR
jgi:uncharacterized protein (DUF1501 family)